MPTMLRDDGTVIDGATYHCTDRYCQHCARKRSQRVYACIAAKLKNAQGGIRPAELQGGFMVTLTQEKPPGLSGPDLRDAREIQQKIQQETHRRLRRHDYAIQRHAYHTVGGDLARASGWLEIARATLPLVELGPCYKTNTAPTLTNPFSGYNPASGGRSTYIWAREITASRHGYDGWHVHAHYLVPTESDAHRLIAAHVAACKTLHVKCEMRPQRISKPEPASWASDESKIDSAARYITQYITKSGIEKMPDFAVDALIFGTHGLRQYDAGGRWRPLGIGKQRDPDAPRVVAVRSPYIVITGDGELIERVAETEFQRFMRGNGAYWSALRALSLNQYRTNLTTSGLADKLRNLAAEKFVLNAKPAAETWFHVDLQKIV